ncbi:MAG: histidine kinase dimerization/phosphoacceptor domain -containing protein [Bacteroidota bacterium]
MALQSRRLFRYLLMLLCIWPAAAFTQQLPSDYIISSTRYSVEEGLASREVFCALQDDDGFMWLGTRYGLNRFDGRQFKLFSRITHGLADDKVVQLAKDRQQRLIIVYGKQGGTRISLKAEVMHTITHKIQTLKEAFPAMPFNEERVAWIANDGNDLCFVVQQPFQYWRLSVNGFQLIGQPLKNDPSDTLNMNLVPLFRHQAAIMPLQPTVYITPYANVPLINFRILRFTSEGQLLVKDNTGKTLLIDQKGRFTEPGLVRIQEMEGDLVTADGNTSERLAFTREMGLWLFTDSANIRLSAPGEILLSNPLGIYEFYKDAQHHYWICTSAGLYKMTVEKNRFEKYFTKAQFGDDRQTQSRGIAVTPAGKVFANLWNWVYEADNLGYHVNGRELDRILFGLLYDSGQLYVGSGKLVIFQRDLTNQPKSIFVEITSNIWSVAKANDSMMVMGAEDQLLTGNLRTGKVDSITLKDASFNGGSKAIKNAYRITRKDADHYWIIARDGLYLLDIRSHLISNYYCNDAKDSLHKLPDFVILDALPDVNGFWLATNGSGLIYFNDKTHQFTSFNTSHGLLSDILYRIENDRFGRLWISTDYGLSCFDTTTRHFENYTTRQGITHNEFNTISSFKAANGKLYFGGLDGVTAFDPADFSDPLQKANEPMRLVSFNQFSGSENKLIDRSVELAETGKILLMPGDKFFTIDFVLLDYREGNRHYAYRIDGIDNDWNLLSDNTLRVSGLRNGTYSLRIRGQNTDGKWSATELVIPVTVQAPIWQRTWFIVTMAALALLLIWAIFKWRTRQLRTSKQALERTVDKRTHQLKELLSQKDLMMKEIHHRVKNNLQVISGLLELQKARTPDDGTRAALEESQNRVLSIAFIHQNLYQHEDLKGVEMESFISELASHIKDVFSSEARGISIVQNIAPVLLDIETALPLGLILNELLTNSFKYAFVKMDKGEIQISLTDDGNGTYGFAYADNGTVDGEANLAAQKGSLGTRLIHQLSRQLNGEMSYYFQDGVKFTLHFSNLEQRQNQD